MSSPSARLGGHSRETLRSWAQRMKVFRYCASPGGHVLEGEKLLAALRVHGERDLKELLLGLRVYLHPVPRGAPIPVPGASYMASQITAFPTPIIGYESWEQPAWREIDGVPVFIWVRRDRVDLSLSGASGDAWKVGDADVANAAVLEERLLHHDERIIDPPLDSPRCLCPDHHPDLFPQGASQSDS